MPIDTYWLIPGAAFLAAVLLTPVARRAAHFAGILDVPGGRKAHARITPLLGGLALAGAMSLATAALLIAQPHELRVEVLWIVSAGSAAALAIGLWDDVERIRAREKLLLQVLLAAWTAAAGLQIEEIRFLQARVALGAFAAPVTVLWIVAVINAWNLLDGLDGLASGAGAIAAGALGLHALASGDSFAAILLLSLAAACAGFLVYNFHPASIFLGDAGSHFLGFLLAVVPIVALQGEGGGILDVRSILFVQLLPIADATAAFLRRWRLGWRIHRAWRTPMRDLCMRVGTPDRRHIHHRLLDRGMPQWEAALVLTGVTAALAMVSFLPTAGAGIRALVLSAPLVLFGWLQSLGCLDMIAAVRPDSAPSAASAAPAGNDRIPDGEREAA